MKSLSRLLSSLASVPGMVATAVTTFPVWGPALGVLVVLHLIGWADFSPNFAGEEGNVRRVGVMWTLSLPTHWIPFIESTTVFSVGLRWLPSSWRLQMIRHRGAGTMFVHAVFGFVDLSFAFSEFYQLSVDA